MMTVLKRTLIAGFAVLLSVAQAGAAEEPQVKVGTLKFGTVNWELKVIADGLDRKHGFALTRVDFADKEATSIALQSGGVPWALVNNARPMPGTSWRCWAERKAGPVSLSAGWYLWTRAKSSCSLW